MDANLGDPVAGLPEAERTVAATSTPKDEIDNGLLAENSGEEGWVAMDGTDRAERAAAAATGPIALGSTEVDRGGEDDAADDFRRRGDEADIRLVPVEKKPKADITIAGKLGAKGKGISPAGGESGDVWMDGRPGFIGRDEDKVDITEMVEALESEDGIKVKVPSSPPSGRSAGSGPAAGYAEPTATPRAGTAGTGDGSGATSGSYYRGPVTKKPVAKTSTLKTTDEARGLSYLSEAGRLYREKKYAPSAAAAREAMGLYPAANPSRAKAARFYGLSMVATGKCDEARLAVGYVGGASKTSLRFEIGACYEKRGSYTKAMSVYESIKREDPETAEIAAAKIAALRTKVEHAARKAKKKKPDAKKAPKKGGKKPAEKPADADEAAEEPSEAAY